MGAMVKTRLAAVEGRPAGTKPAFSNIDLAVTELTHSTQTHDLPTLRDP